MTPAKSPTAPEGALGSAAAVKGITRMSAKSAQQGFIKPLSQKSFALFKDARTRALRAASRGHKNL
jgi:hypothetical protein